jgi:hypothetical protein
MQITISVWTGYLPSEKQIKAVNKIQDQIHGLTSDVKQGVNKAHSELNAAITSAHRANFKHIDKHIRSFENHTQKINELEQKIIDAEGKINNEIIGKTCDYENKVTRNICRSLGPFKKLCNNTFDIVKGPACATDATYKAAVAVRDKAIEERNRQTESLLSGIKDDLENLENTIIALHKFSDAAANTITAIADFSSDISPFRLALRRWDTSIKNAIVAWVDANAETIRLSMQEAQRVPTGEDRNCFKILSGIENCKAPNPLDPIQKWINLYAPIFVGVPEEVTQLSGAASEAIGSISNLINGHARNVLKNSSPASNTIVTDLEHYLSKELYGIDYIEESLKFTKDKEWIDYYNSIKTIFSVQIDDTMINSIFSQDSLNIGLITYDKFTNIMDRDMGLAPDPGAHIDWKKFPALKNAITLSKLALLESDMLNSVARDIGVYNPTIAYSSDLYQTQNCTPQNCTPSQRSNQNIVYYAIRNIDGHEAWKPNANPLPRNGNMFSLSFAMDNSDPEHPPLTYGYNINNKAQGFRFWQEGEYYFNQLFTMPMFVSASTTAPAKPPLRPCPDWSIQYDNAHSTGEGEGRQASSICGSCGWAYKSWGTIGQYSCNK